MEPPFQLNGDVNQTEWFISRIALGPAVPINNSQLTTENHLCQTLNCSTCAAIAYFKLLEPDKFWTAGTLFEKSLLRITLLLASRNEFLVEDSFAGCANGYTKTIKDTYYHLMTWRERYYAFIGDSVNCWCVNIHWKTNLIGIDYEKTAKMILCNFAITPFYRFPIAYTMGKTAVSDQMWNNSTDSQKNYWLQRIALLKAIRTFKNQTEIKNETKINESVCYILLCLSICTFILMSFSFVYVYMYCETFEYSYVAIAYIAIKKMCAGQVVDDISKFLC